VRLFFDHNAEILDCELNQGFGLTLINQTLGKLRRD